MIYPAYYRGELSISPPLTAEDAAILSGFLNGEQNEIFQRSVYAREPADSLWPNQMLMVSEDFARLLPEEGESRPGLGLWVRLLQEYFLAAKGYLLNGQISWEAGEPSDRGTIFLKDGVIEIVEDQSSIPVQAGQASITRVQR